VAGFKEGWTYQSIFPEFGMEEFKKDAVFKDVVEAVA